MASATQAWRDYSTAEKAADGAIHAVGFLGASIALSCLIGGMDPAATIGQWLALAAYSVGLLGMLLASAMYNLWPAGNAKDVLGKVDQAMIFMMIAGSYTPFAVRAFPPWVGVPLCGIVWTIAAMGVALCVGASRLFDRIGTALYLGIGWLVILVMPLLIAAVSGPVLGLLVAGGVVYSLGVVAHRLVHVAFHNVAWHGMVVAAAALHLAAIALILP